MFLRLTTLYLWLELCQHVLAAATFNCYVCSYTLSSDPKLDYECVNQPWNVTKGLPSVSCTSPYQCVTKATFNQGKTQIRSVSRSCLPQQEVCSGENCCNNNGIYPECEHKCREDMCNNQNAEQWFSHGGGGGSGAKGIHRLIVANFIAVLTFLTTLLM